MAIVTRRERERRAHRRDILEAANKIFARKGFVSATMDEIAQEAEFSKAALYLYFKNKEDLFLSLIHEKFDSLGEKLREVASADASPDVKIENLVRVHLEAFESDKEFFQIIASEHPRLDVEAGDRLRQDMRERYVKYIDMIEDVMQEGIEKGVLKDVPPRLLALALTGIIHAFTAQWILIGGEEPLAEKGTFVLELFFHGARRK
ncbi:MAG TPA: TetR/AcrR family transcriptional regulator [Candidatus Latescibacteria bacterium]|nr:TetR/AcrR family transcriptional regulator [Candidatus Latescibacterota bacterium]